MPEQEPRHGKKSNSDTRFRLLMAGMIFVAAVALCAAVLLFNAGAWFSAVYKQDASLELTNFTTVIKYDTAGGTPTTTYDPATGIPITPTTIGNLRFAVTYTGDSAAYLRLHLEGSLYDQNVGAGAPLPDVSGLVTLTGSDWVAGGDGYYYYAHKLTGVTGATAPIGTNVITTPVLAPQWNSGTLPTGISPQISAAGTLYIVAEAVQPDRYPAFWGIETLPAGVS